MLRLLALVRLAANAVTSDLAASPPAGEWAELLEVKYNASTGRLAVTDGEPTGGNIKMPDFSWETLPVAWHSGNSTGRYTNAQIKELARYQMVTLEKFQNLRAVVPAEVLARDYESPGGLYGCQRNATLSLCGCCGEDEIVAVARKIKAVNPKVVTVAYFNAEIGYPWYRAARLLAQNPTWWSTQHYGPVTATWKGWNLTVAAAAAAWQQGCLDVTRTGVVDTCFVDGCKDWDSSLGAVAKRRAIAELQTNVPGPLMCGAGGSITQNELLRSGARGLQDESWGLIDQETGKGTFATREIPLLMAAARAGVVFQAHGRAVCGLAGTPCSNRTQPCWKTLPVRDGQSLLVHPPPSNTHVGAYACLAYISFALPDTMILSTRITATRRCKRS